MLRVRLHLPASRENNNGKLTFYVKNAKTGVIPEVIEADYKIDRTVPTGEIRNDERTFWEKFLNAITFGLFYKEPQTVTITAADNSREDVTVEYWLTDEILTVEQLQGKAFTAYTGAFGMEPDIRQIVYAKLTDKAGNSTTIAVTVNGGHTFGEWTSNDDDTHSRECTMDGCSGHETKDCAGGTATCTEKAFAPCAEQPVANRTPAIITIWYISRLRQPPGPPRAMSNIGIAPAAESIIPTRRRRRKSFWRIPSPRSCRTMQNPRGWATAAGYSGLRCSLSAAGQSSAQRCCRKKRNPR